MTEVRIRPYEPSDRASVREICFRTGYMGEPIDWQWRDATSFADMFSGYYTDVEPKSASVVEVDGVVGGYLLGCIDSSAAWNPGTVAGRHIVRRGIAFRPGTAGVIWRTLADAAMDVVRRRVDLRALEFSDDRWPAHLHIDLLPQARGMGAGRRLVQAWLDTLAGNDVPGCHLGTFAENAGAIAFFEAMGFERHGDAMLLPGLRSRTGARLHEQVMVRTIP